MASAFVDKALQDVELLEKYFVVPRNELKDLKVGLRLVRTFLLYARKLYSETGENASIVLGSFLSRLDDALFENGKGFHNLCLRGKKYISSSHLTVDIDKRASQLTECIYSFRKEINKSYGVLLDCCSLHSRDQSAGFIDYLLLNMADIRDQFFYEGQDPIGDLNEKLLCLKNCIRFAKLRGFDPLQMQAALSHLEVVAVNAARLSVECWLYPSEYKGVQGVCDEMQLKCSELVQKIKSVDAQILEIYIQVFQVSNLSGPSHALTLETDKHVLGDFVDSLLHNVMGELISGDNHMVSSTNQVTVLYKGLRFLRTILTRHLEKIDELHENIKDIIGAAVNESGIVIFSLLVHGSKEGSSREMDCLIFNLLEKIKLIKVLTSAFIFPRSDVLGFMDFLLENLKELPTCNVDSIVFAKDQIQKVQEDLIYLRHFLDNIQDNRNRDEELRSLWSCGEKVAYKAQSVILSLVVGDIPYCSLSEFKSITEEINRIKLEDMKISGNQYGSEAQNATKTSSPSLSRDNIPTINEIVLTLHDEANKIVEQLIRGSKHLDIISIVGMPGLGKTTLARSVYEDPSVKNCFHTWAWCVVSQVYNKKDLLLQILCFVDCNYSDEYSMKNEYELEEKLKKCLRRRRYFIVLDDVWDIEAWSSLQRAFPNDLNSSRILLTSRHSDLAKEINCYHEPHPLRQLKDKESWDLLKKLSFIEGYPMDLGWKIAKTCKGLPLIVVTIAGILPNLSWEEIAERLNLSALSITDQCMETLELSYRKLPDYLRSCLLYFGAFPVDKEIHFRGLIWLWIAEGFVKTCESKSLEDVALVYMNDLICRSLVMVSKERSTGGIKTCRLHDLLHEFCVVKAKKEKFLSILSGHDELVSFHGQSDLQRLCLYSTTEHFKKSWLSCPGVRSLLLFADDKYQFQRYHISIIFHQFVLLEVLDLMPINVGSTFPSEIALLVHLRYLAINGEFSSIPSAVANLWNLETLIVCANEVVLPDTIWNMLKLRVLYLSGSWFFDSCLAKENLERSPNLDNLDTFSTLELSFGPNIEKIMTKLPNIRRLKFKLLGSGECNADWNRIVTMDFLSRLESLHLTQPEAGIGECRSFRFRFPRNLKKLTLSNFHSSIIPESDGLLNLVALKLSRIYFEGDIWDMTENWELPELKFLELRSLSIVRWTGSYGDVNFPGLQKLLLEDCRNLNAVPSCLGDITALQMIEVHDCPESVASLFLEIKEEQMNNGGNEDLQVLTSNC